MRIYYTDHFVLPLPAGHRFPMQKYAMLRERVEAELCPPHELLVPPAATDDQLTLVHTPGYVRQVTTGALDASAMRRIGFPWSPQMVERSRRSVGATIAATRAALREGAAANLAGGTHHAFPDRGEGFCVFNDVAVAARIALSEIRPGERAAVIDLDVHQGNGTAAIFRDEPRVFTASVHGAGNFPFRKEPGDFDCALPDGAGDDEFLHAVDAALDAAFAPRRPSLVYYIAGADAHSCDRLGRLDVSADALAERDRRVLGRCAAAGVPVVLVMGGGYGDPIGATVAIHFHSVRTAAAASAISTSL
jgi:acetoin utilization deacetylase AcuC-like enzyme